MGANFLSKPFARIGKLDPFSIMDHSKPSTADPYAANWAKAYAGMNQSVPATFMNPPGQPQTGQNPLGSTKRKGALY